MTGDQTPLSSPLTAKYGPWAVVAGASEGLGAAFAETIAAGGINLLLLARRGEILEMVAADLRARFGIDVRVAVCDMARAGLAETLEALTADLDIGLAVYNAAASPTGEFHTRALDDLLRAVDVNIRGPLIFARTLAPKMLARRRGGIVLMSSLAGLQGAPRIAVYAASKSFNMILGEGLWSEFRPHGVDVLVSIAGAIRTPNYAKASKGVAPGALEPRAVAKETLAALGRGPMFVPGRFNRFARFVMTRVLSRRAAIAAMGRSAKDLS